MVPLLSYSAQLLYSFLISHMHPSHPDEFLQCPAIFWDRSVLSAPKSVLHYHKGNAVSPNYLLPLWSPFVSLPSPASEYQMPPCTSQAVLSAHLLHPLLLASLFLPSVVFAHPIKTSSSQTPSMFFSIWVLLSALSLSPFFRCDRLIYFPGFC